MIFKEDGLNLRMILENLEYMPVILTNLKNHLLPIIDLIRMIMLIHRISC